MFAIVFFYEEIIYLFFFIFSVLSFSCGDSGGSDDVVTANPLCFTANTTDSTVTLDASYFADPSDEPDVETSKDGKTWNAYTLGTEITLSAVGDKVYFRGNNSTFSNGSGQMIFIMAGSIAASGNIMSLLDKTQQSEAIPCNGCFYGLFEDCTALTSAPALPATTLTDFCYDYMFKGCTNLVAAPALPATTLTVSCYEGMFQECTSLVTAPELSATTLEDNCYTCMFLGCTSLETAPELSATTLKDYCYQRMFYGCTSLNYLKVSFVSWDGFTNSTYEWVKDVGATGTFYHKSALSDLTEDDSKVPSGWNKETF